MLITWPFISIRSVHIISMWNNAGNYLILLDGWQVILMGSILTEVTFANTWPDPSIEYQKSWTNRLCPDYTSGLAQLVVDKTEVSFIKSSLKTLYIAEELHELPLFSNSGSDLFFWSNEATFNAINSFKSYEFYWNISISGRFSN